MGLSMTLLALLASNEVYTSYPAFGDKEPDFYNNSKIQMVRDNGLTRELTVKCADADGIVIHSVIDQTFVDAKNRSHTTLAKAINGTCKS